MRGIFEGLAQSAVMLSFKTAELMWRKTVAPLTTKELESRSFLAKCRDAATRLMMPYLQNGAGEIILNVASNNIHKCRGVDGMVRPERIITVVNEVSADLVALQEVDHRIGTRTGLLNPAMIESETGLKLLIQSDVVDGHGWHGNARLVRGEP